MCEIRIQLSQARKQPSTRFSNQKDNKNRPSSKFKLWNKKNKDKNMACTKQQSNQILLQRRNQKKKKQWQKIVCKTNVKQIENHWKFYIHLYWAPSLKKVLKILPTYMWSICTHVWIMCIYVWTMTELRLN